jgi:predicted lysophospholipase L1 biosynthesis ABC-type transport system permease subunit
VNSVEENNHLAHTVPVSFYPEIYIPAAQFPAGLLAMVNHWFSPVWLVRTTHEDAGVREAMQKALASVDPTLPFAEFRSVDAIRAKALGPQRYRAWVVSAVSALAVILAALGVYGLVAQSVVQRRREMGIRMALGATPVSIIQLCTGPAIFVACAGVVCGLAGAAFAATLLKDVIWHVSPFDPTTYAFVALVLIALAFVASLLPTMRLRRMNPAEVLQEE